MIVRCPSGEETTWQSNPVRGRGGTGKEHRELPSPEVALARYSLSKSSGKETATDAIEIDVSQEDFAAMTNLARTTAGAVLRTLEASIGSLFSRVAVGQLFRKANPLAAPGSDPRGSSSS
jgi:hypothetical protein